MGMAFRLSLELNLHHCLPQLLESTRAGPHDLEMDRLLVEGGRIWLAVSLDNGSADERSARWSMSKRPV
jgi:hypothetical protein